MAHLDYVTAGESHGPGMIAVVSGLPSGLAIDSAFVDAELARRQGGFGRGGRQGIEEDRGELLSGVRGGLAMGSPVTVRIVNKDSRLDDAKKTPPVFRPRPGHADLAGSLKHLTPDCRDTLERASARETAARVAAGALARLMLRAIGIEVFGFVRAIAGEAWEGAVDERSWHAAREARDASETYCPDPGATARQREAIRAAKHDKDTAGGVVETHVFGCPPGIGSGAHWHERLDARLAGAVMGVQAIKGVEIGLGFAAAARRGSAVHDAIRFDRAARESSPSLGFRRDTNHAGGLEGGMTNGMSIVVRAAMKPISTLLRGLPSVDLRTGEAQTSQYERSDICAVPAASVVVENVVAFEVARAVREKFGGDSLTEFVEQHERYLRLAREMPMEPPGVTLA
jgi:chorismate synthase